MRLVSALTLVVLLLSSPKAYSAVIELFDFGLNIDGVTYCGFGPCDVDGLSDFNTVPEVDDSLFDFSTGLGTLSLALSGAGVHNVDLLLDHHLDESDNTFFNEFGGTSGVPAPGQSWEIDEPGFIFGDIFDNFLASTLDSTNTVPQGSEDDVSMALGWNFSLNPGENAVITFVLNTTAPSSGFFLSHTDPDTPSNGDSIYFSSSLAVQSVPEPATAVSILFVFGLALCRSFNAPRKFRCLFPIDKSSQLVRITV